MGNREKKSTFFGGAAVLAAGIVVVKLIGALYKIPLGNILGDEGFGHFNNAYVVYNLLLMISTAGLPVALSKTISEANALGRRNQVHRIFNVALVTFFILGTVSFIVMFALAQPLADFQGDSMAVHAVQAIAPSCFFVCVLSTFRGYAQGHSNMVPTSVSQIIEALGKLVIGLALAWILVESGASSENAAAGAIFGVTAGAALSLAFLIFDHIRRRSSEHGPLSDTPDASGDIFKRLLVIAVPITIGASVVPITSWLDTAQVQNILRDIMHAQPAEWYKAQKLINPGIVDPVVAAYGAYQKAMNVYNLPSSFMVAITASVIPAISACRARRDKAGAGRIAESSLRVGMLLALPAGVGLTVLAAPIMQLLAANSDHSIADPALAILGVASIFVCIMLVCNSILQANGFVNLPILVMVVGCAAKLAVNYIVVHRIGVVGAPVGTLACYLIVALAELALIKRVIPASPRYGRVFLKPLAASLVMGAAAWGVYGLLRKVLFGMVRFQTVSEETGEVLFSNLGNALATMPAILVAVAVYAVLVVVLRAISKEDLSLMPKGEKIAKILRL